LEHVRKLLQDGINWWVAERLMSMGVIMEVIIARRIGVSLSAFGIKSPVVSSKFCCSSSWVKARIVGPGVLFYVCLLGVGTIILTLLMAVK
jgi:hypothetical protein